MKMKLKLAKPHPKNGMRFGKHLITRKVEEFDLTKEEVKALDTKGPKHWIVVVEDKKASKKKEA